MMFSSPSFSASSARQYRYSTTSAAGVTMSEDRSPYNLDKYGKVMSEVMRTPLINIQAKALYGILATYVGSRPDGTCWPTLKTLSADAGLSKPMVIRYLAELESAKVIEKVGNQKQRVFRLTGKVDLTNVENRPKRERIEPIGKAGLIDEVGFTDIGKAGLTDANIEGLVSTGSKSVEGVSASARHPDDPTEQDKFNPAYAWPSLEEFVAFGTTQGVPLEMAEDIFYGYAKSGWKDIQHWGYALINAHRYRTKNKKEPKSHGSAKQSSTRNPGRSHNADGLSDLDSTFEAVNQRAIAMVEADAQKALPGARNRDG